MEGATYKVCDAMQSVGIIPTFRSNVLILILLIAASFIKDVSLPREYLAICTVIRKVVSALKRMKEVRRTYGSEKKMCHQHLS
jgi:hypothetical protein